jgi:hypothetical protein
MGEWPNREKKSDGSCPMGGVYTDLLRLTFEVMAPLHGSLTFACV